MDFQKIVATKRNRILITISSLVVFYIYLLSQRLFEVNNHNDFSEYFLRAQIWANGEFFWGWGMDKMLSVIEFISIKLYPNNFISIYNTTNFLIITLLILASGVFILKENDALPPFEIKLISIWLLLTMPYFIMKAVTIDQSMVLTIMLLFFLTSYNNRYLGIVSLLVFLSRPESFIIFPLYLLLWYLDKNNRKKIVINFISFLLIFAVYKYLDLYVLNKDITFVSEYGANITNSAVTSQGTTFSFIEKIGKMSLAGLITLIQSPVMAIIYGLEILQNYVLFLLFLVGFVVSFLNRKMWIFYAIFLSYFLLQFAYNGFYSTLPISESIGSFWKYLKFINNTIATTNGAEQLPIVYGHSRYRLFLYPAVAIFSISGIYFLAGMIKFYPSKKSNAIKSNQKKSLKPLKKSQKPINPVTISKEEKPGRITGFFSKLNFNLTPKPLNNIMAISMVLLIVYFTFNNIHAYKTFSEYYKLKKQMANTYAVNDYSHLAMTIRKTKKASDLVFFGNICINPPDQSFITFFESFSGIKNLVLRICPSQEGWIATSPDNKKVKIFDKDLLSFNKSMTVVFNYELIDYKKTSDTLFNKNITKLMNFDLSRIDSLKIKYIITEQQLNKPGLELIGQHGKSYLFMNTSIK